jgi:hypothetical protein
MYGNRKNLMPIYGSSRVRKQCVATVSSELDINVYLRSLRLVLASLEQHNNKAAAIENIEIMETRITNALTAQELTT